MDSDDDGGMQWGQQQGQQEEFEQSGFPAPIKSGFENGENNGIYRI